MSLVDIEWLERMHDLICRNATGTPDTFSEKLGISKSMLMINLAQLKEKGGPIQYDALKQTYYYTRPCRLVFGYEIDRDAMGKIKGGKNIFDKGAHSNLIRMGFCKFEVQQGIG
ncbi:MAG: hypothetical protein IT213_17600 [Cytophagales bacterium]|jgi:hypothetical protein|nr:hypothetical protein [Cytophagales bacterium]